jgi:hypothetical protein
VGWAEDHPPSTGITLLAKKFGAPDHPPLFQKPLTLPPAEAMLEIPINVAQAGEDQ